MGSYKITKNNQELNIIFEGAFNQNDAQSFVTDFQKEVAAIKPSDYHLLLDCTKLGVASKDMQELLKGCIELYKSLNFNKITMNVGSNVIMKMQLQRLAKDVGLENFSVM